VAILVSCPCGKHFRTNDANAGREAQCSDCGRALTVPSTPGMLPDEPTGRPEPLVAPFSGRAIASFVLGLASLGTMAFAGLPAIALGVLGLADIRKSRGRIRGALFAMAGVALGIVGSTVMSVLIPTLARSAMREPVRRSECVNNLKQIGLAMHNFNDRRSAFPKAAIYDRQGRPLLSWRVAILPFLGSEEAALYRRFHLKEPWDSPHNRALLAEMPKIYRCPSEPDEPPGMTPYQLTVGPGTLFNGRQSPSIQDITAGTSNTVLLGEANVLVPWTAPEDVQFDDTTATYGGPHPGVQLLLYFDGSVRVNGGTSSPPKPTVKRRPVASAHNR
jgi:hypothetical protein